MKKILFLGAMAAMLLGITSCSSDMEPTMGGEVPVSFAINLGDNIDSRTISDGLKANQLKFAVFENNQEITGLAQTVAVANKQATINTKLVKGHTYTFVFWAQNSACTAYNTADMSAIKVDYAANCNDETRDAFYKMDSFTVTEAFEKTEVLTRPFAQINFLADDAAGVVGVDAYKSKVTVTGVPTTLNTLDGTVGTETTDVTFALDTIPNETLAGYETYKYVAMNYILAATDKEMKNEVVLTVNDGTQDVNTVTVTNCPVQRNYRTNIFGSLFTVDGKFNVVIDPIYAGDHDVDLNATYYEVNETMNFSELLNTINTDQPEKAIIKIADGVTLTYTIPSARYAMIDETNTKTKSVVFEGAGIENSTFHVDGNGVQGVKVANGALVEFKNLTITDDTRYNAEDGNNAWEFAYLEMQGNMNFDNVKFADGIQIEGNDSKMEFTNCFFIADGNPKRDANRQSNEYAIWISGGTASFTNCDYTGFRGPKIHEAYGSDVAAVYFDGCNFHDLSKKPGLAIGNLDAPTIVSIKNSTFKNCQAGDQDLYIYESDTNVANFNFINENNTVINE